MLIRGNHECRNLSAHFNFKKECISKYGEDFHEAIQDSFDTLPLACLINKRMLGIHGGISEKFVLFNSINYMTLKKLIG